MSRPTLFVLTAAALAVLTIGLTYWLHDVRATLQPPPLPQQTAKEPTAKPALPANPGDWQKVVHQLGAAAAELHSAAVELRAATAALPRHDEEHCQAAEQEKTAPAHDNPPPCPLTRSDKETRVAIVAVHPDLVTNQTCHDAHLVLSRRLGSLLETGCKERADGIKVVPVGAVDEYVRQHKDKNKHWKQTLGRHFGADYVVFLELGSMSLFEPGSSQMLFRGKVEIHLTVIDVSRPERESPQYENFHSYTFPESGPLEAGGVSAAAFQSHFLEHVAKDLAGEFVGRSAVGPAASE